MSAHSVFRIGGLFVNEKLHDSAYRDSIALVGDVLGPLFLDDPEQNVAIRPLLQALGSGQADAFGDEWPFAGQDDARWAFRMMCKGIVDGGLSDEGVWEYRRLFVGPNPMPVPPWGSVYTDREQVIFGVSTIELHRWMGEQGIDRQDDEKTPEDHIGFMLLLLSWLARHKPDALEEYLRDHLLTWSSHFLAELEEAANQPFYQGLARLTRTTLEGLQEDLNIVVEYPRYYR
jgi:TorA maturation chaperone TorD